MKEELRKEIYEFLDELRASGRINMLLASSNVKHHFNISKADANRVTSDWMVQFEG